MFKAERLIWFMILVTGKFKQPGAGIMGPMSASQHVEKQKERCRRGVGMNKEAENWGGVRLTLHSNLISQEGIGSCENSNSLGNLSVYSPSIRPHLLQGPLPLSPTTLGAKLLAHKPLVDKSHPNHNGIAERT
jgi:hypothetical protein